MSETIGFIGLGNMGLPMAENLMSAGYSLRVFNRTAEKAASLVSKGARIASTPAEVAAPGGVVITMLSNDAAVEEIAGEGRDLISRLGPEGIHNRLLVGLAKGREAMDWSALALSVSEDAGLKR